MLFKLAGNYVLVWFNLTKKRETWQLISVSLILIYLGNPEEELTCSRIRGLSMESNYTKGNNIRDSVKA